MASKGPFKVVSQDDYARKIRVLKSRTPYTKTSTGCLMCKEKKVKCDEARPVCTRCKRNHRQCSYTHARSYPRTKPGFSVLTAETIVPFSAPSAKHGTSSLQLMQHLQAHWVEILQMPQGREIISLFQSSTLVRNTILALTACHLRHVSPGVAHHRIAEYFQQSLALKDYQAVLDHRHVMKKSDVHTLLLSAVLLNVLALALPESENSEPRDSWVFSRNEDRLGWLALQAGLRPLIVSMAGGEESLNESLNFLSRIFLDIDRDLWTRIGKILNPEVVPESWKKMFGLDRVPEQEGEVNRDEVFQIPIMVLGRLRNLEPLRLNALKNFAFLAKMKPDFRDLLYQRDERALWAFGYWLGLMQRFEGLWWCERRVKRDYAAVLAWLRHLQVEQRPGVEGKLWREMMREVELVPVSGQIGGD